MRADSFLKAQGVTSKKALKRALNRGLLRVDGQRVQTLNAMVEPRIQHVTWCGVSVFEPQGKYLMLNKPSGIETTLAAQVTDSIMTLIKKADQVAGLSYIGRLDKDTTGLLLLTDNGQLNRHLTSPEQHVVKKYQVWVNGLVTEQMIEKFAQGIVFTDQTKCRPAELAIISGSLTESQVVLAITEGKFHQVKKMFLAVGLKVCALKRLQIDALILDDQLASGQYRELTTVELGYLKKYFY